LGNYWIVSRRVNNVNQERKRILQGGW